MTLLKYGKRVDSCDSQEGVQPYHECHPKFQIKWLGATGIKRDSADSQTTKKIVLRKECQECKRRVQVPLKRVKHFEL